MFSQARNISALFGFRGGIASRQLYTAGPSALTGALVLLSQIANIAPHTPADTATPATAFAAATVGTIYTCATRQYTGIATSASGTERTLSLLVLLIINLIYATTAWFVIIRPWMNMAMGAMMSATLSTFWMVRIGAFISGKCLLSVAAACALSLSITLSKLFTIWVQTYFLCIFSNTLAYYKEAVSASERGIV